MINFIFRSVQLLSRVRLFETPWTAAHQASLSITNSQSLLRLMFIQLGMPSNHLALCHPLLLLPSIFPNIGFFSKRRPFFSGASLIAQLVKNPHVMWETWVRSLGWEYLLENGKATHPSILAWRIPWTAHGVTKSQTQLSNFPFHFLRSWGWVVLWRNFISTLSISFFLQF